MGDCFHVLVRREILACEPAIMAVLDQVREDLRAQLLFTVGMPAPETPRVDVPAEDEFYDADSGSDDEAASASARHLLLQANRRLDRLLAQNYRAARVFLCQLLHMEAENISAQESCFWRSNRGVIETLREASLSRMASRVIEAVGGGDGHDSDSTAAECDDVPENEIGISAQQPVHDALQFIFGSKSKRSHAPAPAPAPTSTSTPIPTTIPTSKHLSKEEKYFLVLLRRYLNWTKARLTDIVPKAICSLLIDATMSAALVEILPLALGHRPARPVSEDLGHGPAFDELDRFNFHCHELLTSL